MPKRKFKIHLLRSPTHTVCGRSVTVGSGWIEKGWKPLPAEAATNDEAVVTCRNCLDTIADEEAAQ